MVTGTRGESGSCCFDVVLAVLMFRWCLFVCVCACVLQGCALCSAVVTANGRSLLLIWGNDIDALRTPCVSGLVAPGWTAPSRFVVFCKVYPWVSVLMITLVNGGRCWCDSSELRIVWLLRLPLLFSLLLEPSTALLRYGDLLSCTWVGGLCANPFVTPPT